MKKTSGIIKRIMMPLVDSLTPTCDVITQKISESMDHPISLRDRFRIRVHILFCVFCNRYRRQLLAIRDMLKTKRDEIETTDIAGGPVLSADAKERIRQSLHQSTDNDSFHSDS